MYKIKYNKHHGLNLYFDILQLMLPFFSSNA